MTGCDVQSRILVTGGAGHLAREILKMDGDVLAPSRKEMDISSYDAIESYCSGRSVSIVIHAAAVTNKFNQDADEGYLLSNIIGTANVVLWCSRHKARLVYVSSDYVYPGERGGYSEQSPLLPVNRYAASKLGGECSVGLLADSLIVRTSFYRELNFAEGCTDQYTSRMPIGEAAEVIRRGDCTAVICGAAESPLLELVHIGFTNMRGLGAPLPGKPIGTVSRPFDRTRDGFVMGEGAGALIVEDLELAKARGAKIYAEVVGYGSAADGYDMIAPAPKGEGAARSMKNALLRRGVLAEDVGMINPHGTSTPMGDKCESEAIWDAFGSHTPNILISATKSMTGHMMGAAGAFEGVATVLSVYHQTVPGTINYVEPDPECNVNVATETIEKPLRYAMSNNIGLGGHNAAVIFKQYTGD